MLVSAGSQKRDVERALLAVGRTPVVNGLGLETLGVELDKRGLTTVDPATLQIGDLPVFMAGDVNGIRPSLHEAANEGSLAGHNAPPKISKPA